MPSPENEKPDSHTIHLRKRIAAETSNIYLGLIAASLASIASDMKFLRSKAEDEFDDS